MKNTITNSTYRSPAGTVIAKIKNNINTCIDRRLDKNRGGRRGGCNPNYKKCHEKREI